MLASNFVGRIGTLAAALGVGAALFASPGIAWAEPASTDAAGSAVADAGNGAEATSDTGPRARPAKPAQGPRTSVRAGRVTSGDTSESDSDPSDAVPADVATRSPKDVPAASAAQREADAESNPAAAETATTIAPSSAAKAAAASESIDAPENVTAPAPAAVVPALTATPVVVQSVQAETPARLVNADPVKPAASSATLPAVVANAANQISTAITSLVSQLASTFSGTSPIAPPAESPANWLLLAASRREVGAAATSPSAAQTAAATSPTLFVLNGYNVVSGSIEEVTAFTGRFTYWPGMPNMLQGRQELNLVDPATKQTVGSFEALVTSGDPTSIGGRYVQLLVTDNDGTNVGTGAGQIPPVGSMISTLSLGLFSLSYSAMPSPSGDKVSVKLKTLFGDIALPFTYDASKGIADGTFDNRPMELGGGFSIAPADPSAEKITATIGLLPLFNSVQGRQIFSVYDSTGKSVGSFDGEFTTTSDVVSIYTQAIRVIANDGVNVGTKPGQTPPVGTVYNVAYFGSDDVYLLYSSMPQQSGDVISITAKTPLGTFDVPPSVFNSFNASSEPPIKSLTAPGGQKFVATSVQLPSGVNGLPPRDVQIQGYQQFDVYDVLGRKIGSVDANVASQWDGFGIHSKSLLITEVRTGKTGSTPFDVPPVGSVLNFTFFEGGFGLADTVLQLPEFDLNALSIVTPLGAIPLLPLPIPVRNRQPVEYFNPFLVV